MFHSSTLRTMQEIFDVDPASGYPWLDAAETATGLSGLFKPGAIKTAESQSANPRQERDSVTGAQ